MTHTTENTLFDDTELEFELGLDLMEPDTALDDLDAMLGDDLSLDLDDLLAESMELRARKDAGKEYRKQLQRAAAAKVSDAEIEALRAKIAEWEDRVEWTSQSLCFLRTVQVCKCCQSRTPSFGGFYLHQIHRTKPNTQRWHAVQTPTDTDTTLPKTTVERTMPSASCIHCQPMLGFPREATASWDF